MRAERTAAAGTGENRAMQMHLSLIHIYGNSFSIKPFPVKALKGFGGGDGYAAAFLYGLLEGKELLDCLEMGSAEAAMLVASHACSADMPGAEALYTFIRQCKDCLLYTSRCV